MSEIDDLKKSVSALVAREEIRDVLYRYTRCMDRFDIEGIKSCYHPDANDIHWGTFVGNAHEFAEYMVGELQGVKYVVHEITNPLIDLHGDRAFVESRYTSRVRLPIDGAPEGTWLEFLAHGRYLDAFEKRNHVWKVAHRRLAQDGGTVGLIKDLGRGDHDGTAKRFPEDYVYKGIDIADFAPPPSAPVKNRFEALHAYGKQLLKSL